MNDNIHTVGCMSRHFGATDHTAGRVKMRTCIHMAGRVVIGTEMPVHMTDAVRCSS